VLIVILLSNSQLNVILTNAKQLSVIQMNVILPIVAVPPVCTAAIMTGLLIIYILCGFSALIASIYFSF